MSLTKALNSKSNIKQYSQADLPVVPRQLVIARYAAESTAGQTVITFPFAIDVTNNPDVLILTVDGKTLTPGALNDYTFPSVDSYGFANSVTLTAAMAAGLNIQAIKLGLKKETEFVQDQRFNDVYESLGQGLQAFIAQPQMVATVVTGSPVAGTFYSSIANRPSTLDLSQDLKPRMGLDRISISQLVEMAAESGPNGERVFGVANDNNNLIRFVGSWSSQSSTYGQYGYSTTVGDFVEITFFGTGLNLLTVVDNNIRDFRASVDGGAEGATFMPTVAGSAVLGSRNYAVNTVVSVVNGLSLGTHTVKIRFAAGINANIYGVEAITDTANMRVQPGTSYGSGKKSVTASQQTISHNATFEAGTLGTRGGRALVYQKADGSIAKVVNPTAAATAFLAATNHANEDVVRTHYWREFGAGRADDFSTSIVAGSGRTGFFTLDDGTTTLAGTALATETVQGVELLRWDGGNTVTFTFVGTGLDIITSSPSLARSCTISVDGTSVGNITNTAVNTLFTKKIVSGLPYGTHTVRMLADATNGGVSLARFIVYQPKKPVLPVGAVELADFNVMADFVANTTSGTLTVSQGILRKMWTREPILVGNWTMGVTDVGHMAGIGSRANANGDYIEYTFYGTGFDLRHYGGTSTFNFTATLSVDGSSNLSAFSTSVYGTASSFVANTGVLTVGTTGTYGNGLVISGLPLAKHTVRLTRTSAGTGGMVIDCLDVITPIHSAKSSVPFELQNTLMVGNQGLLDTRAFTATKELVKARPASVAFGVAVTPSTTSTTLIPCPDMSVVINSAGGLAMVGYSLNVFMSSNTAVFQLYIDGQPVGQGRTAFNAGSNDTNVSDTFPVRLSPGVHIVQLYWQAGGGTLFSRGANRTIFAIEQN